jgi:tetratricopeptide (TPR) repeat protein
LPAFESLRKAQTINSNVGHYDLGSLLAETGLLEPALRALRRAIEIDPTNESARAEIPNAYWYVALYDDAIKANQELSRSVAWAYFYYVGAGRLEEARRMIDQALARNPHDEAARNAQAFLLAYEGRHAEARKALVDLAPDARRRRGYHHLTYLRACLSALAGDAENSVRWLRETAETGLPVYPAFGRDHCFDPIRHAGPFTAFMAELKPVWEAYERQMRY